MTIPKTTRLYQVRFTPEIWEAIAAEAAQSGKSYNTVINQLVAEALQRKGHQNRHLREKR